MLLLSVMLAFHRHRLLLLFILLSTLLSKVLEIPTPHHSDDCVQRSATNLSDGEEERS